MKKKHGLVVMMLVLACSCRPASGHWNDGLAGYRETHSADLSIELLRMASRGDTSAVNYRIRLRPSAKNNAFTRQVLHLNFQMDSSFFLKASGKKINPVFVQAVPDGIKGCYEYLVSFPVAEPMKHKPLSLVYDDHTINEKAYTLFLNKQ